MGTKDKSRLLIEEEQPLLVLPKLASKIGLNESILLQQLHYWNQINEESGNNYKDGYYWTYNSYEKWKEQFPFWSESTIRRTIGRLKKLNLIVTGNYNKMPIDRTKWYRIDYERLKNIEKCPSVQNEQTSNSIWTDQTFNMSNAIPETPPKTPPEISGNIKGVNSAELTPCVFLFFDLYEEVFGDEHPYIKIEKLSGVSLEIESFMAENDTDLEAMEVIIRKYFNTPFDNCDYNICHFASQDIMMNRFYEELY